MKCKFCGAEVRIGASCEYCGSFAEPSYYEGKTPKAKKKFIPLELDHIKTTHTVVKGETLWNIAKKYYGSGAKYHIIARANGIEDYSCIEVGQVLKIP